MEWTFTEMEPLKKDLVRMGKNQEFSVFCLFFFF